MSVLKAYHCDHFVGCISNLALQVGVHGMLPLWMYVLLLLLLQQLVQLICETCVCKIGKSAWLLQLCMVASMPSADLTVPQAAASASCIPGIAGLAETLS